MRTRIAAFALTWLSLVATTLAQETPRGGYARRWVYSATNLQVDRNAEDLAALIRRAGRAGYNGVMLADYKFNILDRVPDHYWPNVRKVQLASEQAGVEIIPAIFPIGYSSGLLAHDPNLAEGLRVVDAPFLVTGREARLDASRSARYVNGGLEEVQGDRFAGMSFQDDPGRGSFADRQVVHGGKVSCRFRDVGKANDAGNARLVQRIKVRPRACYRASCWIRTVDLDPTGGFRLMALGGSAGKPLTFLETELERDEDWRPVDVVFNSLDETEINLYVGLWGGKSGSLWVDDIELEELGPVNVLRRPGCPVSVASEDGTTVYREGSDYEPLVDPKLGMVPYAGEYSFKHDAPPLRLARGSRIRPGQRLRVSWYHPVIVHGFQVACCLSEPRVDEILRDQARRVVDLLKPRTVFMSHDELRVANHCASCKATGKTPGQLLADNVKRCVDILKSIDPRLEVVVWSDMFDPQHNAVDAYYLVDGPLAGSWEGLPRDVVVANWNEGKAAESLKFFADRGHRQIIVGYYDADDLGSFERWHGAARGVPGVVGFMYTTWRSRYDLLEAYGRAIRGGAE